MNKTGLSDGGIKKIISKLKNKRLIRKEGSTKVGHWEIIDKDNK